MGKDEELLFGMTDQELKRNVATYTAHEIAQQPNTWSKTVLQIRGMLPELHAFIDEVTSCEDFDVVLTGAGTSEYIGNTVFPYLNERLGHHVHSYASTDIVAAPHRYLSKDKPTILVSYGRSGDSPESVGAIQVADAVCANLRHLFVTCNRDGALSRAAAERGNAMAVNLAPETLDKSFAMTSSYTNMALATLLAFCPDEVENIARTMKGIEAAAWHVVQKTWSALAGVVEEFDFRKIVYLGSNCLKGVAQESQLKMLELTQGAVATSYDSPMGFRHGPKSLIDDATLSVVYLSDDPYTRCYERDLVREISAQRKGNRLMVIGNGCAEEYGDLADWCFDVEVPEQCDNVFLGLAYIVHAQVLALFKSMAVGITPDDPCPSGEVNRVVQGVEIYPVQ